MIKNQENLKNPKRKLLNLQKNLSHILKHKQKLLKSKKILKKNPNQINKKQITPIKNIILLSQLLSKNLNQTNLEQEVFFLSKTAKTSSKSHTPIFINID